MQCAVQLVAFQQLSRRGSRCVGSGTQGDALRPTPLHSALG